MIPPWFLAYRFPYSAEMRNWMRDIPGFDWDKEKRVWLVPVEMKQAFLDEASKYGLKPVLVSDA